MESLTTKQKLVLQQMMWKRCTTREDAKSLLNNLSINEDFDQFIRPINQQIGMLRMKIARGTDEITGNVHYALVNLAETHLSRLSVQYSLEQKKMLRCVLEMLAKSKNGQFTFKDLYQTLLNNETRFTRSQTQSFLKTLIDNRFLCSVSGGNYALDVRGCIELEPYFVQNYADLVHTCNACRTLCLRGFQCNSCQIKLHQPCLNRSLQQLDGKCPSCSNPWASKVIADDHLEVSNEPTNLANVNDDSC